MDACRFPSHSGMPKNSSRLEAETGKKPMRSLPGLEKFDRFCAYTNRWTVGELLARVLVVRGDRDKAVQGKDRGD